MGTRRVLAALVASILLVLGSSTALADVTIDAQTNAVRQQYGLSILPTSAGLTNVATIRVSQIVSNFAHPSSWQWLFDAIPGCESAIGENIAYYKTGYEPEGWPVSAWMASPLHRDNILRPGWTHQGSARLLSGDRTYAVQLFSKACTSTSPAPQPNPQPPIVDEIPDTSMAP